MKNSPKLYPILAISEISYPEYVVDGLKAMTPRLISCLEKGPIDLESGYLPFDLRELEFPMNISFSMFEWIADSNIIFQNLNMILGDFRKLAEYPSFFEGSQERRLKILIRTFFYEIFRLREIFAVFLSKLQEFQFLNKKDAQELKHSFGKHFDNTIKIRNKMVHESFPWIGKSFSEISIIEGLKEFGKVLADKDLTKIHTSEEKVIGIYNELVPVLLVEGHYVSHYINDLVKNITKSIEKISTVSTKNF